MTQDTRNARVIIALIASMTVGSAMLYWLNPHQAAQPEYDAALTAASHLDVDGVTIAIVPLEDADDRYDCVVFPEPVGGQSVEWRPRPDAAEVRIAVVQTPSGMMSRSQKEALLAALQTLRQNGGLDLDRSVRLHPESDWRVRPDLPEQAYDLRDLLVRKQIIR